MINSNPFKAPRRKPQMLPEYSLFPSSGQNSRLSRGDKTLFEADADEAETNYVNCFSKTWLSSTQTSKTGRPKICPPNIATDIWQRANKYFECKNANMQINKHIFLWKDPTGLILRINMLTNKMIPFLFSEEFLKKNRFWH